MSCDGLLLVVTCLAKFPSEEWAKLFMEQLNANKSYEEAAKTWEGDFLFVIGSDTELDNRASNFGTTTYAWNRVTIRLSAA